MQYCSATDFLLSIFTLAIIKYVGGRREESIMRFQWESECVMREVCISPGQTRVKLQPRPSLCGNEAEYSLFMDDALSLSFLSASPCNTLTLCCLGQMGGLVGEILQRKEKVWICCLTLKVKSEGFYSLFGTETAA